MLINETVSLPCQAEANLAFAVGHSGVPTLTVSTPSFALVNGQ